MTPESEALLLVGHALRECSAYRVTGPPPDWERRSLADLLPDPLDRNQFFEILSTRLLVHLGIAFNQQAQERFPIFRASLVQQTQLRDILRRVSTLIKTESIPLLDSAELETGFGVQAAPPAAPTSAMLPATQRELDAALAPPPPSPAPKASPPPAPLPEVPVPSERSVAMRGGLIGGITRLLRSLQRRQDAASDQPNATLVRIFYATDRLFSPAPGGQLTFSSHRSLLGKLNYGECEVSIPKLHRTGGLESPSLLRFELRPNPARHIVLTQTLALEEQLFFDKVHAAVNRSAAKDVFVFVHGYNVSFGDAARRTGQIAFDLSFAGAPVFYSWPSNGHVADYLKDETNVAWSAPHFEIFLATLAQRSGAERIHIIAHSMGNRAVCEALRNLSRQQDSPVRLTHLVLAAPDIDAATFAELASTLRHISHRVTLYESSNDRAIQASKRLHGNPRAGEPLLVLPGLDTVDASLIDTDFLGHSYFSDNWPLLSDIHSLLAHDSAPGDRFGLGMVEHPDGRYFTFRP